MPFLLQLFASELVADDHLFSKIVHNLALLEIFTKEILLKAQMQNNLFFTVASMLTNASAYVLGEILEYSIGSI